MIKKGAIMEKELELYEVKVKDNRQDIVHVVHAWGKSKTEADTHALEELEVLLRHSELVIV